MRILATVAFCVVVWPQTVAGQAAITEQAETGVAAASRPFDIEFGTDALVFKGTNLLWLPADLQARADGWTPFINYDFSGHFNYDESKDRIADLAVEAAILKSLTLRRRGETTESNPFTDCTPDGGVRGADFIPYAEMRGRFADIAKSGAVDWKGVLIGGAGLKVRIHSPRLMNLKGITGADVENPTLALTYYEAFVDNDAADPAASDTSIAVDQLQLAFTADIPLTMSTDPIAAKKFLADRAAYLCDPNLPVPQRPSFPYTVSIALKAGRPIDRQNTPGEKSNIDFHADVALKMLQPGNKMGFVLRYRTGPDLGFEYDTQLLAGIVYRLFE